MYIRDEKRITWKGKIFQISEEYVFEYFKAIYLFHCICLMNVCFNEWKYK